MSEEQIVYNGEFTIEQRKIMTAQILQELRKSKKLSQKEVAGNLNIPATTYNTYESGRTEPPIEILVRLSYLYGMPVDFIVQRDRLYTSAEDVTKQMTEFKAELADMEKQIKEQGVSAPGVPEFMEMLNKLADAMTTYSQTEAVKKAVDIKTQD